MKPNPLKILKIYQSENRQFSFDELAADLQYISKIRKCTFCGCYADTLLEFADMVGNNGRDDLAEAALSTKEKIQKKYDCIGCNPCYPADISNLLFEMESGKPADVGQSASCGCTSECSSGNAETWPVEKGDYFVGDPESPVAVCALANTELPQIVHAKTGKRLAIVGYCETENVGVEKVVKNIVSNSAIRHLLLCGNESGRDKMGHFAGQAIQSLHANGLTETGRIIGARGKRPVLKNLSTELVGRFQAQVEIVDLIGNNSPEVIFTTIERLLDLHSPKFIGGKIQTDANDLLIATRPKRLVLDKKGFFVILPNKEENKIYVEVYENSGKRLRTVVGRDAATIYSTIIGQGFVSKLDHAAYLGKELTRAEYSLKYDIPYIQDKAPGELVAEGANEA